MMLPVAICLIATAVASFAFIVWSARGEDQRALARQTALARHVIELQLARIPHDQQCVTIWDDAIVHTRQNFDPVWIENNLGVWMYDFFRHDEVLILDGANRPIYAMAAGRTVLAASADSRLTDLQPLIAQLRRSMEGGALAAYESGRADLPSVSDLALIGGIPSLVSIEPIVSDSGDIPQAPGSEYLHVSIVHLDADYAKRLADEYSIAGARFSSLGESGPDRAMLPLTNSEGRFVTFFDWTRETPGQAMLNQTLPVMGLAFIVATVLALFLIEQLRRKSRDLEAGRADAEYLARHDPLTGLPNRASFESALARALRNRASTGQAVSVLMLDLDRFKQVNDTLGHDAGDDLIVAVGQRLAQYVASDDMLARLGGDEFTILMRHPPDITQLLNLSHQIVEAIGKPFRVFGSEAFVGVSIGIATTDGDDIDSREILRKADIALYEAKTTGRNRAVVFEESMNELLQNRHAIEAELREALRRNDRLSVDFQPLFGPGRARIIGAEALARWFHPAIGQVSPAHFIPVAEQSGLIGALGELVLRRACEFGAKWPGTMMAVNVSPVQLRDEGFPARVFALLSETGMRPADLELEITEGILLEDSGTATDALRMFRSAGIRIALDDFGTG
jgi:diguanylate cyclase (GGDEF)-like protein